MPRTSNNLLQIADREPYAPVTDLIDIPVAMFEIETLAARAERGDTQAASLIRKINQSVIDVLLNDAESLLKLEEMIKNGYRIQFVQE
jgi:hypothetical protein